MLLAHADDPKGLDGVIGANTNSATEAFQKSEGLSVDGVIGQNTWTALVTS